MRRFQHVVLIAEASYSTLMKLERACLDAVRFV